MTIDKHNIEACLLDYSEGRLDPVQTAELMAFLAENPEYEVFLPDSDPIVTTGGDLHFENSARLKKDFQDVQEVNAANFDEFCIAASEGLLSYGDLNRLEDWLQRHPEKRHDYLLYRKLKLQPDTSVVFAGKASLKKGTGRVLSLRYSIVLLGIAASLALFLLLYHPSAPKQAPGMASAERPAPEVREKVLQPVEKNEVPPEPAFRQSVKEPVIIPAEPPRRAVSEPLTRQSIRETLIPIAVSAPEPMIRNGYHEVPDHLQQLASAQPGKDRESIFPPKITALFRKLDLWKAAESAVSGFNYLTESQVSISRTLDENGQGVGLALGTEQFVIRGNKVK